MYVYIGIEIVVEEPKLRSEDNQLENYESEIEKKVCQTGESTIYSRLVILFMKRTLPVTN